MTTLFFLVHLNWGPLAERNRWTGLLFVTLWHVRTMLHRTCTYPPRPVDPSFRSLPDCFLYFAKSRQILGHYSRYATTSLLDIVPYN